MGNHLMKFQALKYGTIIIKRWQINAHHMRSATMPKSNELADKLIKKLIGENG